MVMATATIVKTITPPTHPITTGSSMVETVGGNAGRQCIKVGRKTQIGDWWENVQYVGGAYAYNEIQTDNHTVYPAQGTHYRWTVGRILRKEIQLSTMTTYCCAYIIANLNIQ